MNPEEPDIRAMSIVLIGTFNPAIFQPAWFAAEQLLKEGEAREVKIEVIHSELTVLMLDWFRLQVTSDKFVISTTQEPYYEVVRDFVLGVFSLLPGTPMQRMGINRDFHYRATSEKEWHGLGDRLAPKELWNGVIDSPGLRSLVMEESRRRDGFPGFIRVKVEPSSQIQPGVYIQVNDHYEVPEGYGTRNELITILEKCWGHSIERSSDIAQSIVRAV